jgi:multiple sugar transport system permease protein
LTTSVSSSTPRPPSTPGAGIRRRSALGRLARVEWLWGVIFAAPAVVLVGLFVAYPLGTVIYYGFTRWNGLSPAEWVGFHNYTVLASDPVFRAALRNNFLFALSVPIQMTLPLVLAYLIHMRITGWSFFRATFFIPATIATVIVGIVAYSTFQVSGALNTLLGAVGLHSLEHNWLASAHTSIPLILVVVVWANFGYNVLIYLAGMSALDPALEEAARMDGARAWRILISVVAPNLRRVMELVLVTSTVTAFAYMFTYIYVITNGGPGFDTNVAEFQIYYQWFTNGNAGYACAMATVLLFITVLLGLIQIRVLTRRAEG